MEYTTLNNGIKMPMVGFGVFQIQTQQFVRKSSKKLSKQVTASLIQRKPMVTKKQ